MLVAALKRAQPSPAKPNAPRIKRLSCNAFQSTAKHMGCFDPERVSMAEQSILATYGQPCSPWSAPELTRHATWPKPRPAGMRGSTSISRLPCTHPSARGLPAAQARATWGVRLDTGCSVWLFLRRISAARSATMTTAAPVWPPVPHHAICCMRLPCTTGASPSGIVGWHLPKG